MKELNLQEIRQQLDVIDASLTELFETRMELCREVAEYKIQTGKPVYDREREQQKLKAVTALAHSDFTRKGTYELFSSDHDHQPQASVWSSGFPRAGDGHRVFHDRGFKKGKMCGSYIRVWRAPMDTVRPAGISARMRICTM